MSSPRKPPSLLATSIAWSIAIAVLMTAISFLHQRPGDVADIQGGLGLRQAGILFLIWFGAAEALLLIGGGIYLGMSRLRRGGKGE